MYTEPEFLNIFKWQLGWKCDFKASEKFADIFNKKCKYRVILVNFVFRTVSTKQTLKQTQKIAATVSPAVYMTFEKTALLEKLTFQPPLNL
jgi:hypothetical protein